MEIFAQDFEPASYFCDWTCVHLIMSWQKSPKFDFQSQFSMYIILFFVSVKIIRLREQLIIKPFFDDFIFWISSFSEIGSYSYSSIQPLFRNTGNNSMGIQGETIIS